MPIFVHFPSGLIVCWQLSDNEYTLILSIGYSAHMNKTHMGVWHDSPSEHRWVNGCIVVLNNIILHKRDAWSCVRLSGIPESPPPPAPPPLPSLSSLLLPARDLRCNNTPSTVQGWSHGDEMNGRLVFFWAWASPCIHQPFRGVAKSRLNPLLTQFDDNTVQGWYREQ